MIVVEILLTIYLWLTGYRWIALVPAGGGVLLAMIVSFSLTLAGKSPQTTDLLFIDTLIMTAQTIMLGQKALSMKKKLEKKDQPQEQPPTSDTSSKNT